jgi:hypothetical protein
MAKHLKITTRLKQGFQIGEWEPRVVHRLPRGIFKTPARGCEKSLLEDLYGNWSRAPREQFAGNVTTDTCDQNRASP